MALTAVSSSLDLSLPCQKQLIWCELTNNDDGLLLSLFPATCGAWCEWARKNKNEKPVWAYLATNSSVARSKALRIRSESISMDYGKYEPDHEDVGAESIAVW